MASIKKFTELLVWQKAHTFVLDIYKTTEKFPASEQFGLTSQLRRAAVSITSNIVEGFDRGSPKEFKQFLIVARASLSETQNQTLIALDLNYISRDRFDALAVQSIEIHKMINGLIKSLQTHRLDNSKLKPEVLWH